MNIGQVVCGSVEEQQRDQAGMPALLHVGKNKPTWKVAWTVLKRKKQKGHECLENLSQYFFLFVFLQTSNTLLFLLKTKGKGHTVKVA